MYNSISNKTSAPFVQLLLMSLVLTACDEPTESKLTTRKPNTYEILYQNIAVSNDDSRFCYKIFHGAWLSAPWSQKGFQSSYLRSDCFFKIAQNTNNPELCNEVVSISKLPLDGSKISQNSCTQSIQATTGKTKNSGMYVPPTELISILKKLGYTPDVIPKAHKQFYDSDPEFAYVSYFTAELNRSPKLIERLIEMPDFIQ